MVPGQDASGSNLAPGGTTQLHIELQLSCRALARTPHWSARTLQVHVGPGA